MAPNDSPSPPAALGESPWLRGLRGQLAWVEGRVAEAVALLEGLPTSPGFIPGATT